MNNSSEDLQGGAGEVEEHFASHQDIRSQLNKIMKVGILSHSDDAVPQNDGEIHGDEVDDPVTAYPTDDVPGYIGNEEDLVQTNPITSTA